MAGPHQGEHSLDVARLETSVRHQLQQGTPHHAPGNGHLTGPQPACVKRTQTLALATHKLAIGLGGNVGEVGILLGEDVRRRGQGGDDGGVPATQQRQYLMTDIGA